jgi:hypothetical protein
MDPGPPITAPNLFVRQSISIHQVPAVRAVTPTPIFSGLIVASARAASSPSSAPPVCPRSFAANPVRNHYGKNHRRGARKKPSGFRTSLCSIGPRPRADDSTGYVHGLNLSTAAAWCVPGFCFSSTAGMVFRYPYCRIYK